MNETNHRREDRRPDEPERSMEELHAIARYQRAIIYCVLGLLIGNLLALFPLPFEVRLAGAVGP